MHEKNDTSATQARGLTQTKIATWASGLLILTLTLWCGPWGCLASSNATKPKGGGGTGGTGGEAGTAGTAGSGGAAGTGGSGGSGGQPSDGGGDTGPPVSGLHVVGNKLMDNGKTVRLLGVDRSGTEYGCVQQGMVFPEGPTSVSSLLGGMTGWGINTIRVPLNEDCWLGINGANAAASGAAYTSAITTYVQGLRAAGMYVIVDLHWNAPGSTLSMSQQPMADEDNAPAFWMSVASTFKGDNGIVFDLYNEPYPDLGTMGMGQGVSDPGTCMLNGCELSSWTGFSGSAMSAGMQQLVTTVRGTGATNVIMIAGWTYANTIGTWLTYEPTDPLNNLAASFHTYNYTGCSNTGCWMDNVQYVAETVPVITGELGENDCNTGFVDSYFAFADPLGISYLGWAWNADDCSSFPSLITNYGGSPTAFGQAFMTHLPTQSGM